ncbi:MAG: FAD-dependent oxidoreductase [Victivallales bacterium]|jgi:hypothetical protein|nr:FAD-dependent oxidoreductase [Victivallales bacterium]
MIRTFSLVACFVSAALLAQPALDAPVASWTFEKLVGLTVPDTSGNANDLQVRSAMMVKGLRGKGLAFSPDDGNVFLPTPGGLRLSKAMSIDVWFNPTVAVQDGFAALVRSDGSFALRFANSGHLGFLLWNGEQVIGLSSKEKLWKTGVWHHAVATYDGTKMRLYVNGKESASLTIEVPGLRIKPGGALGVGSVHTQYRFSGTIDEVRLFARALSAKEIEASYQRGLRAAKTEAGIVVKPERVGETKKVFRKPLREVGMVKDGFVWLDAEDFTEYGGWTIDTQFVHLMGSAYLLATGVGVPVEDATTEFDLPKAGTYRVWVRDRNWVKGHSPGTFQILVNGKPLGETFGDAPTSEWTWEDGGRVQLPAGKVKLSIHDLTGYYGRCDALVLTTDQDYRPPAGREAVCAERARLTGLTLDPLDGGEFDVIVVGGGPTGCPAAIAAARMGAKTALIQNRPVLGGNASDECGVPLNGAASHHRDARETGIAEETARFRAHYGYRKYSTPFQMLCDAEPNLSVFLNKHAFDVEMADDKTIRAIKAVDTLTGAITVYRGKFMIDTTGDGWVGYFAKAEYRLGRESKHEFNESLAPEKADKLTMSGCLMGNGISFRASNVGKEVPFVRPPWAREIDLIESPGRAIKNVTSGNWWIEHPNDIDDVFQAEEARDELIKISFSYFDFVKNKSKLKEQARNYVMNHIPHMDAKRESRRLVGDYILNQNDCEAGDLFPDRISYGGWPMDVHHPEGIFSGKEGSFWCNGLVPIHTIPYRCIYSKNIDNLFFAGRCASVTHIALGSIRVESTLATLGQAAGTAAAMCIQHKTTPRGIYQNYIGQLQQTLLKNDQTIPGIVNEDTSDMARGATVTASSTADMIEFRKLNVKSGDKHELAMARGMFFPWPAGRLDSLHVLLTNTTAETRTIKMHLRTAAKAGDVTATEDLAASETTMNPKGTKWMEFEIARDLPEPFAWFWIEKTEGVNWSLMTAAPPQSFRFYGAEKAWTIVDNQFYAFYTKPALCVPASFSPSFVVNGTARKWDGKTNMWASDPRQEMPQWLELGLGRAQTFNSVYLTFDTNLAPRLPSEACPPEAVRDYQIQVPRPGGGWRTVAETKGNFLRRRIHRFKPVTAQKMRVKVLGTNGVKEARVFEVRIYNE